MKVNLFGMDILNASLYRFFLLFKRAFEHGVWKFLWLYYSSIFLNLIFSSSWEWFPPIQRTFPEWFLLRSFVMCSGCHFVFDTKNSIEISKDVMVPQSGKKAWFYPNKERQDVLVFNTIECLYWPLGTIF